MRHLFRKHREFILCALFLLVPLVALKMHKYTPVKKRLTSLDSAILRVTSPFQRALTGTVRGAGNAWERYVALIGLQDKNIRLRSEVRKMLALQTALKAIRTKNARLRRLLRFKAAHEDAYRVLGARVIGLAYGSVFRTLRIDRGEVDGLKRGQPVVVPEGVVGRVSRVYRNHADVALVTDPRSSVDVVVQRTGHRAVLKGLSGRGGPCRTRYLLAAAPIKQGDLLVTSGMGRVFPPNLPVARVDQTGTAGPGVFRSGVVALPAAPLRRLVEILVVVRRGSEDRTGLFTTPRK